MNPSRAELLLHLEDFQGPGCCWSSPPHWLSLCRWREGSARPPAWNERSGRVLPHGYTPAGQEPPPVCSVQDLASRATTKPVMPPRLCKSQSAPQQWPRHLCPPSKHPFKLPPTSWSQQMQIFIGFGFVWVCLVLFRTGFPPPWFLCGYNDAELLLLKIFWSFNRVIPSLQIATDRAEML